MTKKPIIHQVTAPVWMLAIILVYPDKFSLKMTFGVLTKESSHLH